MSSIYKKPDGAWAVEGPPSMGSFDAKGNFTPAPGFTMGPNGVVPINSLSQGMNTFPTTSMPAPSGYQSFYDQQRQNFQNPYDSLRQGAGGSSVASPTAPSTGSLPNQTSAPDLTSITNLVNSLNRQGQQAANEARVPGSGAVEQTLLGNTAQLAQGQLPQDVINQIQQQAAERGVSTGNSDYLRSLGLTSLQAQQAAQSNLTAADARNPVAPLFNPATMLLTPAQQAQIQYQQGLLGLDWYRALTGQGGGGGGGRSAAPTTAVPGTDQANANWWNNLMGGTPSPEPPPPTNYGSGATTSYTSPGGSTYVTSPDFPSGSDFVNPPSDSTFNQYLFDSSIPSSDTSSIPSYDPFLEYNAYAGMTGG